MWQLWRTTTTTIAPRAHHAAVSLWQVHEACAEVWCQSRDMWASISLINAIAVVCLLQLVEVEFVPAGKLLAREGAVPKQVVIVRQGAVQITGGALPGEVLRLLVVVVEPNPCMKQLHPADDEDGLSTTSCYGRP